MANREDKIEYLFVSNYTDTKHKLLTTKKVVPNELLEQIETRGITTEELEALKKKGFDIFTYQTQITIHGVFKINNTRIGGYKNLTVNKNKSLGIRWNAIDKEKKDKIQTYLRRDNWKMFTDSKGTYLELIKVVNDLADKKKVADSLLEKCKSIKTPFFGTKQVIGFNYFGRHYVALCISLDGIFEANVNDFINDLLDNFTVETLNEVFDNEAKEREAQDKLNEAYRAKKQASQDELKSKVLEKFKKHNPVKEPSIGAFIEVRGLNLFKKVVVGKAFGKFNFKRSSDTTEVFESVNALSTTEKMSGFGSNFLYIKL